MPMEMKEWIAGINARAAKRKTGKDSSMHTTDETTTVVTDGDDDAESPVNAALARSATAHFVKTEQEIAAKFPDVPAAIEQRAELGGYAGYLERLATATAKGAA